MIATPDWSLARAQPAPTPAMGWNSWNSYATTVNEKEVKANADAMARQLAAYAWRYIVVQVRDLWQHEPQGRLKALELALRRHASAPYRLSGLE